MEMPLDIDKVLSDPDAYESAIQHIYEKRRLKNQSFREAYLGVNYIAIDMKRRRLARLLAKTVASGQYELSPVDMWMLEHGGKWRPAHRPTLPDLIVGTVIARVLSKNARIMGQPGVYAYQPGLSNYTALSDFARFVRRPEHKNGLFVMQSDFTRYGENIPVYKDAIVWEELRRVADMGTKSGISENAWALIMGLVRPVTRAPDGTSFSRLFGIPMGTPVVAVTSNLAINQLDLRMTAYSGAFFARFNDDFLFAHKDPEVVKEADTAIDEMLGTLGVTRKPEKTKRSYLNGAGKTLEDWAEFKGRSSIEFLGLAAHHSGTLGWTQERLNRFFRFFCKRLDQVSNELAGIATPERARVLVKSAETLLEPTNSFAPVITQALIRDTTNRAVLKDLDNRIAKKVAQRITGRAGVIGFRSYPPERLRQMGLPSLVAIRNLR